MDCDKVQEILKKYDIKNEIELEDLLETYLTDCEDDDTSEESKQGNPCLKKQCYDSKEGIPSCRKLIEIYTKFYKSQYKKKEFVLYLADNIDFSQSTIENWLSCKQCTNSNGEIVGKVKEEFLKEFCNALEKKFDHDDIFKKRYGSIKVFTKSLEELTKDNFTTKTDKLNKNNEMEKIEQDKLYDMIHVSKAKLQENLSKSENLIGSDEYKLNLAIEAFERRLDNEAFNIVNMLKNSNEYKNDPTYLQLKAKLLSNKKKDKEAIEVLENLINIQSPNIDVETHNLLAASIKRDGFNEWKLYSREENLINSFIKSKEIYQKIFNINHDYYPAVNIVYIEMMLAYIEALSSKEIEEKIEELKSFWSSVKFDEKDYWSYISNIEFLIVTKQYEKAKEKIDTMMQELDEEEISEFMSFATGRQMMMFMEFFSDNEFQTIVNNIKTNL